MIHWSCPSCREPLEAPDALAGDGIQCPTCRQSVRVPTPLVHSLERSARITERVHPRRLLVAGAALIGMSATFMPWIKAPIVGSIAGTSGDGWFSFAAFFAAIMLVFSVRVFDHPGAPLDAASEMSNARRIMISLCGLFAAGLGIVKLVQVYDLIDKMRDGGESIAGLMATATQPGVGLFLTVIAGFAVLIIAGNGVRLAAGNVLTLGGVIVLLLFAGLWLYDGFRTFHQEFDKPVRIDWDGFGRIGLMLLGLAVGTLTAIFIAVWLVNWLSNLWSGTQRRYAQRLYEESREAQERERQLAEAAGHLHRTVDNSSRHE